MTTAKTLKIEGTFKAVKEGSKADEKRNQIYMLVSTFCNDNIKNIGDTKPFNVLEKYVQTKWNDLPEEITASVLPSINDIVNALREYYLDSNKEGSYINIIFTRDGAQRLQRCKYVEGLVKIAETKKPKTNDDSNDTTENKVNIDVNSLISILTEEEKLAIAKSMNTDSKCTIAMEEVREGFFTETEAFKNAYEVTEKDA